METHNSQIQITTKDIKIKAGELTPESLQAILDFTITHHREETSRMKKDKWVKLEPLIIGVILALLAGITTIGFKVLTSSQQSQEVQNVK